MSRWLEVSTENCSVQAALDVVGQKWTLLVLREMFNGVKRFEEMRRHLGISEAVLTRRLAELASAGVVESRPYREPGKRTRHEYVPTSAGWDLFPVVVGLLNWGDRHRAADGPSWVVRHRDCGVDVTVAVCCPAHRGLTLTQHDTEPLPGPAARTA
jgi:DNA-binding HxlR family transcriptional regulator